jgi:hypothetical protein
MAYPGYLLNLPQPDQAFPAGGRGPGSHPTGSSRDSRMAYPGYLLNLPQPDQAFPAGGPYPGRHSTG